MLVQSRLFGLIVVEDAEQEFGKRGVPEVESGWTAFPHCLVPHFHATCHRDSLDLEKHVKRLKIVKTCLGSRGERGRGSEIPAALPHRLRLGV